MKPKKKKSYLFLVKVIVLMLLIAVTLLLNVVIFDNSKEVFNQRLENHNVEMLSQNEIPVNYFRLFYLLP